VVTAAQESPMMPTSAVHVRFVGMLGSERAEALARAFISGLDALHGIVAHWDVCLQPPLAPWGDSGFAVRAQARMNDGCLVAIRAQGPELEDTVREAFDGLASMLLEAQPGIHSRQ
jgi:hypothetical protein